MRTAVVTLTLLIAFPTLGQQLDRFLLPIHLPGVVDGAFGSRWVSELRILNSGTSDAYIDNYLLGCTVLCPDPIPPGKVVDGAPVTVVHANSGPGALLLVDSRYRGQFVFQSRVRDLSRGSERWGAWLPVVPESQVHAGPLNLLAIPLETGYRHTLRIYSFDSQPGQVARVRIFVVDPDGETNDSLVKDIEVVLLPGSYSQPAYVELTDLVDAGQGKEARVAIEPTSPASALWAMVSVTNNASQEVSMIVPNSVDVSPQ